MELEEALQKLQKTRKENEEAYLKAKAFMDGFRARGQLSQKDNEFLFLLEFVIKGFKNHGNDIITAFENQVRFTESLNNLQAKLNDTRTGNQATKKNIRQNVPRPISSKRVFLVREQFYPPDHLQVT